MYADYWVPRPERGVHDRPRTATRKVSSGAEFMARRTRLPRLSDYDGGVLRRYAKSKRQDVSLIGVELAFG